MSFDSQESSAYAGAPFELYKFTKGTQAWYIVKGDVERVYLTQTYVPEQISSTEIELNRETSSGSIEVTLTLDSVIAAEFITSLPAEPIWLTKFEGHDGDDEVVVRFKGRAMQAKHGTSKVVVTFAPMTTAIGKKIPPMVYQQSCNRIHYSAGCGATLDVNANDPNLTEPDYLPVCKNAWSATVESISGFQVTLVQGGEFFQAWVKSFYEGEEDYLPHLSWGYLQTSDGRRVMISKHVDRFVIELKVPIPGLKAGDIVTVTRGCRRTFKHCQFYKREASFMAFDIMPSSNPFSGIV